MDTYFALDMRCSINGSSGMAAAVDDSGYRYSDIGRRVDDDQFGNSKGNGDRARECGAAAGN